MTKKEYDEMQEAQRTQGKVKTLLQANLDIRRHRDAENKRKAADMLEQRHLQKLRDIETIEERKRLARELEEKERERERQLIEMKRMKEQ